MIGAADMKTIDLCGKWNIFGQSPSKCLIPTEYRLDIETMTLEGTVPGCIHTDLMAAEKVIDPFWRYNGDNCQWVENWSWAYEREFECDMLADDAYIEFMGLDVYADVYLNKRLIGHAEDMFVPHRFPVAKHLKKGNNKIKVVFYSPIEMTHGKPALPAAFTNERVYTRRMQCTYLWDWCHRFVTMGIFRPVRICFPEKAELENVFVQTTSIDKFSAQIKYSYEFAMKESGCYVKSEIIDPDGKVIVTKSRLIAEDFIVDRADIAEPKLWWPNGYGEHPLYTLRSTVTDGDTVISVKETKFGIRTVKVLQLPDAEGTEYYEKCLEIKQGAHVTGDMAMNDRNEEFSGFILLVNGEPIMAKGGNWVPCEPFPSAETPEKITALLELSADAHVNMIRVWGGGIYEQEHFYNECDRLGITITQDLMMACGEYPDHEEWFMELLKKEAVYVCKHLRNHPCIVWWSGDNECGMGANDNMPEYWCRKAAFEAAIPVFEVLDPTRQFMPSSPTGGVPNCSITKGSAHNTNFIGLWFSYMRYNECENYMEFFDSFLARFCAEGPVMGAPSVTSLRKFMNDEDIFGDSGDIWRYHTKNNPNPEFRDFETYDYLKAIGEKLFGKGKSGQDLVFKLQYTQYEWIRISMELYRRNKWFSSGMVYWMLNDCWPASGWAMIDYYALPKAALYGFKQSAKPVRASIERKNGEYKVYMCNDGFKGAKGETKLFVYDMPTSSVVKEYTAQFVSEANTSKVVLTANGAEIDGLLNADRMVICETESDFGFDRTFFFIKRPQDVNFPEANVTVLEQTEDTITVTTDKYVHAVGLEGEYVFSDNYFSLMPGEKKTVSYKNSYHGKGGEITVSWLGKKF